jgi:hypothetical protein
MKKQSSNRVIVLLVLLSAAIYAVQFALFHDLRDTGFYMLQDWAFLPIQVALVTIIAGRIVNRREKENRVEKTRMLASTFFSELGGDLLQDLKPLAREPEAIAPLLRIGDGWSSRDFARAAAAMKVLQPDVCCTPETLMQVRDLLAERRSALLMIASNPALLEHESFTDMLWAVFHLSDELTLRGDLKLLSPADLSHLNSDVRRVLTETLANWIRHMDHLHSEYPYLFQLELYRNPFVPQDVRDSAANNG